MLIELASSTTLVPAYFPDIFHRVVSDARPEDKVIFIVCGDLKVSAEEVARYRQMLDVEGNWDVVCDGVRWTVPKGEQTSVVIAE
jgi:L-serine/L-threonine ammonia-lyase